jgi:hypothetical protein
LRGRLLSAGMTPEDVQFGIAFSNVVLVLMPLASLLASPRIVRASESPVLQIVDVVQWAFVGLLLAVMLVFVVAVVAVKVERNAQDSTLTEEQIANIHRLLVKLEDFRAKDILKHPHAG